MSVIINPGVNAGILAWDKINLFDFLSVAEQNDYTARTGNFDLTTKINNWLASIPSGGARLIAPAGRAITQGGHTIANPFMFVGAGCGDPNGSQGITRFECITDAVTLFTAVVSGTFRDFESALVAASTSAGSKAITAVPSNASQCVNYEDISINGFYDQIDVQVGNSWTMRGCLLLNGVHYGLRIRNTINADAGDPRVVGNFIYPANGALAGIQYESSGGALFADNKIIANAGTIVNGINMALTGASSGVSIQSNSIDGCSAEPVKIAANGWIGFTVANNYLRTLSTTASALNIDSAIRVTIAGNIMIGGAGGASFAMIITNTSGIVIEPQRISGFANDLSQSGNSIVLNNFDIDCLFNARVFDSTNQANIWGTLATAIFRNVVGYDDTHGMSFFLPGNVNHDGVLARDLTKDQWYGGATSNDTSLSGTAWTWDKNNNFAIGNGAIATNATDGFASIPTCAGQPTGVPTILTVGCVPLVYDTTNHKLWAYEGGAWKRAQVAGVDAIWA